MVFAVPVFAQPGAFLRTGNMIAQRSLHTATLLPDGRVLLTGGTNGRTTLASAEIYDPATGSFRATGSMSKPRSRHSAVLLPDGRVLIVGHDGPGFEVYDPATGTFSRAPVGSYQPWGSNAAMLPDGRVLIFGDNADIYDPRTGTADWLGSLGIRKGFFWESTATVLPDGKFAVSALDGVSLFDPRGGSVRLVEKHDLGAYAATVTRLATGRVFIAGGYEDQGYFAFTKTQALLYDPRSGIRPSVKNMFISRGNHSATLLTDGRVFISGGVVEETSASGLVGEAELFDPTTETFVRGAFELEGRWDHTATLLQDGRVLLAGGYANSTSSLYIPETRAAVRVNDFETLRDGV